ncbi:hypothetical protein CWO90_33560 [Bradyrhizobium sp. Leo121]|nr:hypothetical protein CWO90_33560 [Bradyrhizobium sp. Leo121]
MSGDDGGVDVKQSVFGWLVLARDGSWRVDQLRPELAAILHEIERALDAKLYYVAIAVALSVPDVCACLECDPDKPIWGTVDKYTAWCDANLRFASLEGADLARLRGGVLHQGHFGHPKSKFNRVIFLGPESPIKAHDVIMTVTDDVSFGGMSAMDLRLAGRILHLDVLRFCQTIIDGAKNWILAKTGDPFVERNLANLVRYRPDGLPPFSYGVPTIA